MAPVEICAGLDPRSTLSKARDCFSVGFLNRPTSSCGSSAGSGAGQRDVLESSNFTGPPDPV